MPLVNSTAILCLTVWSLQGCSPMMEVGGAYFPGWLMSAAVGMILVGIARGILIALKVEPFLQPRMLVYPALAVFFTLLTYLLFFT